MRSGAIYAIMVIPNLIKFFFTEFFQVFYADWNFFPAKPDFKH